MTRRLPLGPVFLLVGAVVLAGCGGNSSASKPGAIVTVTQAAAGTGMSTEATPTDSSSSSSILHPSPILTPPVVPPAGTTPTGSTPAPGSGLPTFTTAPPTSTGPAALPTLPPSSVTPPPAHPVDVSKAPRTYDEALAHFDATGQEPAHLERFVTPSGNLYCSLDDSEVPGGCELRSGAVHAPRYCRRAPSKDVGRVELDHGRVTAICNTDTIFVPGAPTLPYGSAAEMRGGDIVCLSEAIGVTCLTTDTRTGFFLHKGQYILFTR